MAQRRTAIRITRPFTPEESQRMKELRAKVELDKEEIIAEGKQVRAAKRLASAKLREAFTLLKEERLRQGMSLGDIESRTGIGRGALSRLENEMDANPTVGTLERYAEALGKTLVVTFAALPTASP